MTTRSDSTLAAWLAAGVVAQAAPVAAQSQRVIAAPDEIVVTARKREQLIQDVPAAVSALSSAQLDAAGVETVLDLARQIPALEALTIASAAQTTLRLRRIGNLGNISTFEPAVGVFVDGAFRSNAVFAADEFFDLERIEVLRGPQGALYGKNTTAGVVAIYTAPPARDTAGDVQVSIGNIEGARDATSTRFRGGLSGPLSEKLSAGLGVSIADAGNTWTSALQHGGEDANDADRLGARSQLAWNVTDALALRLVVSAMQEDDRQMSEDVTFDPAGFVNGIVLPTLQAADVSDVCLDNDPHNRRSCLRLAWRTDLVVRDATLLTDYRLASGATLSAVTSWDEYQFKGTADDVAEIAAPVLRFHNTLASESFQQDLRIASPEGTTFDWLAGLFYYESKFAHGDSGNRPTFLFDALSDDPTLGELHQALFGLPFPLPFATQGQVGTLDGGQDTDYLSAYAYTTWRAGRRFALSTGVRWQDEDKNAHVIQGTNDPAASVISLLLSPASVRASGLRHSASGLTWSITPQWFATDATMLFLTMANGFKSGGFNVGFGALPIADREFGDEDIEHLEVGIKSDLWQRRLRLSASAFDTDYDNYQDAAFVGTRFTVGNAERVHLQGVEVEGTAQLTSTLNVELAASYADLVYATNTHGACYPGRLSDSPTEPGACDLSGEHPINAPRLRSHLAMSYAKPVSWGNFFARLDWTGTSKYNTSFSADPSLKQPSYDWIDLRTGVEWGRFQLVLWAENLTDETVVNLDAVLNVYSGDNSYQSYLQAPRSFGITFGARLR